MATKCDKCLNSRVVVSENGLHSTCILPAKKIAECMITGKFFTLHPLANEERKRKRGR